MDIQPRGDGTLLLAGFNSKVTLTHPQPDPVPETLAIIRSADVVDATSFTPVIDTTALAYGTLPKSDTTRPAAYSGSMYTALLDILD
jgi:hypothetical protein